MSLPKHLSALMRPEAYPHSVRALELVQTHVSWVLLTGEWAYKIKRPVEFAFVDLRSEERRAFYCEEEVRLNRRFAPDLYLEVCAITESADGAHLGGDGRVIEHAVKMLQFPREHGLDRLLASGSIEPHELERFGGDLADLHAGLPIVADAEPWGTPERVRQSIVDNIRECESALAVFEMRDAIQALHAPLMHALAKSKEWLSIRRKQDRVRECHGDLHVRNVVRHDSKLIAFDCMEFEPAFRWIDVAEEIAFLAMDLERYGRPAHAHAFLNGYLTRSGDYEACRLIHLYAAHCALVRAKVAALEVKESGETREIEAARARCSRYVQRAQHALAPQHPRLILVSGLSGSGKTWLAKQLAPRIGAIHVRSDVERKRLAGLSEQARSGSTLASGLYSRDSSQQVYQRLAQCAGAVLAGGFSALVDATFLRKEDRSYLLELADGEGLEPVLIHCHAPDEVLKERISQRQRTGADASEADLSVLEWQQRHAEKWTEDELFKVFEIDTASPNALDEAVTLLI